MRSKNWLRSSRRRRKTRLIWYLYGVSLLGTERYKEAAATLERALSASRDNDHQNEKDLLKIYNSLAIAHGRAGTSGVG